MHSKDERPRFSVRIFITGFVAFAFHATAVLAEWYPDHGLPEVRHPRSADLHFRGQGRTEFDFRAALGNRAKYSEF